MFLYPIAQHWIEVLDIVDTALLTESLENLQRGQRPEHIDEGLDRCSLPSSEAVEQVLKSFPLRFWGTYRTMPMITR